MRSIILLITNVLHIQALVITHGPGLADFFKSMAEIVQQHGMPLVTSPEQVVLCQSFPTAKLFRTNLPSYSEELVENVDYELGTLHQARLERREFTVGYKTVDVITLSCKFSGTDRTYHIVQSARLGTYFLFLGKTNNVGVYETQLIAFAEDSLDPYDMIMENVEDNFFLTWSTSFHASQMPAERQFRGLAPIQRFRLCSLVYDSMYPSNTFKEFVQEVPEEQKDRTLLLGHRTFEVPSIKCTVAPDSLRPVWETFFILPDVTDRCNIFVAFAAAEDPGRMIAFGIHQYHIRDIKLFIENGDDDDDDDDEDFDDDDDEHDDH